MAKHRRPPGEPNLGRSPGTQNSCAVVIIAIGTDFNVADFFTKPVEILKFNKFTAYIFNEPSA